MPVPEALWLFGARQVRLHPIDDLADRWTFDVEVAVRAEVLTRVAFELRACHGYRRDLGLDEPPCDGVHSRGWRVLACVVFVADDQHWNYDLLERIVQHASWHRRRCDDDAGCEHDAIWP